MTHSIDTRTQSVFLIDSDAEEDLTTQLRGAFTTAADAPVTIDLHRVDIVGPDFLSALSAGIDAGREIAVIGVTPEVYKALHVAGLAARLRRA